MKKIFKLMVILPSIVFSIILLGGFALFLLDVLNSGRYIDFILFVGLTVFFIGLFGLIITGEEVDEGEEW